jgi:exonuclease VII large subunit
MQVGMCVVQVLESELTSSQQDVMNITTHSRSQVSNLNTLLEDKEGKTREAQQQHEAAEAKSAAQLANLKTRMDAELAALTSQLESEQKRRVAAEEQHKAAQADLALSSEVAEQLKSEQAVLLTQVGVVSVLVMQVLSDRYVMHYCSPQAVKLMLLLSVPIVNAPLALDICSKNQVILPCPHALVRTHW